MTIQETMHSMLNSLLSTEKTVVCDCCNNTGWVVELPSYPNFEVIVESAFINLSKKEDPFRIKLGQKNVIFFLNQASRDEAVNTLKERVNDYLLKFFKSFGEESEPSKISGRERDIQVKIIYKKDIEKILTVLIADLFPQRHKALRSEMLLEVNAQHLVMTAQPSCFILLKKVIMNTELEINPSDFFKHRKLYFIQEKARLDKKNKEALAFVDHLINRLDELVSN